MLLSVHELSYLFVAKRKLQDIKLKILEQPLLKTRVAADFSFVENIAKSSLPVPAALGNPFAPNADQTNAPPV